MIRHVAILLALRFRLLIASFSPASGRRVSAILGFVALATAAFAFGMSSYFLVKGAQTWAPGNLAAAHPAILRLVFLSTFLLQAMTGVAFLTVADFFDTTRLLHLPVRARSVFVAILASSILSPATLVFAAPAVGAVVALDATAAPVAVRLCWVLALVVFGQACALAIGHALLLALNRRRVRDLATILGSILGVGSYLLLRLLSQRNTGREWEASGPFWDALGFAPTSWFADPVLWHALQPADAWRVALPVVAMLASIFVGAASFGRFYERAGETGESAATVKNALSGSRFLPAPVAAVMQQTVAIIWREPQLKAMLFQQMVFLLVPIMTLSGRRDSAAAIVPFFLVLSHAWIALGLFGIDGAGIRALLQSPATRREIILGRVLGAAWIIAMIDLIAVAALMVILTLWDGLEDPFTRFLQVTVTCLIADGVVVSAGALVSVVAPYPIVRKSRHSRMRQDGCGTHAGRAILSLPVLLIAAIVGSVATLPALIGLEPVWYFVTIPGALLVVAQVGAFCIDRGALRLALREEEIVRALVESGE